MIRIQLERKQIKFIYLAVIVADLFFLVMNTPWISLPIVEGQRTQLTSLFDFARYQLDLKHEQNIATWYSSVLLLAAGVMALLNCVYGPVYSKLKWVHRMGWSLIGFVIIALSADETATIHETLAPLLNATSAGGGRQYRVGAGDWIPILLPLIIIVAVCMSALFLYLFRTHRNLLIVAICGILCWVGGVYAESIEAGIVHLEMQRVTEGFIEEGFEIVGTTCLLIAFSEFFQQRQSAEAHSSARVMAKGSGKLAARR